MKTSSEPEMEEKFLEEIELMNKFIHPNIVSLLGVYSNPEEVAKWAICMHVHVVDTNDSVAHMNLDDTA